MAIIIKPRKVEILEFKDDEVYARRLNNTLMAGRYSRMSPEIRESIVKAGLIKYYRYRQKFIKLCCLRFSGKISKATFSRSVKNKHFKVYDLEKSYESIIKTPMFFLACKEMRILPKGIFEEYFKGQGISLVHALGIFRKWIEQGGLSGYAEFSQFKRLQNVENFSC